MRRRMAWLGDVRRPVSTLLLAVATAATAPGVVGRASPAPADAGMPKQKPAPTPAKTHSLELSLVEVHAEHSRDAHSITERYRFDGATLRYEWSYAGHHPDKKFVRHREREVTVRDPTPIVAALERAHLLASRSTVLVAGDKHGTLALSLDVTLDGKEAHVRVEGPAPDDAHPSADARAIDELTRALDGFLGD